MKPQHFHLVVAALAGAGAVASVANAKWLAAVLCLGGGVVALIKWKAIKSSLLDL